MIARALQWRGARLVADGWSLSINNHPSCCTPISAWGWRAYLMSRVVQLSSSAGATTKGDGATPSRDGDGGQQDGGHKDDGDQPASPPMRLGLKLRMDTSYGQDKAVLTKLLQEHGVAVRGGIGGAMQLLDILMEWKRMPPPPGDSDFSLLPNEEGHGTGPDEYMAEVEAHWQTRKLEWLKRPEYKDMQPETV